MNFIITVVALGLIYFVGLTFGLPGIIFLCFMLWLLTKELRK